MPEGIDASRIKIETLTFENGQCQELRVVFGPHHFVEVASIGGQVRFRLGTTHHGFETDASEVSSQLEKVIGEVRQTHSELRID